MTALLTVRGDKADKTLDNLKEAKRLGIKILPPDINKSFSEFSPEKDGIRYGLLSIAGIGQATVNQIVSEREQNGPYKSFDDFVERHTFKGSQVKRNHYQILIAAGCFDRFEKNRYKLLNYYNFTIRKDKVWTGKPEDLEKDNKAKATHSIKWDESSFNEKKALEMERELIGVYVSGSPYDDLPFTPLQDMKMSTRRNKELYDVGGRITSVKVIKTKKGKPMAFLTLETQLEPMEVTVFPDVYDEYSRHLYKDNIIVVRGYKTESYYGNEKQEKFIAEKFLVKKAKKLKKELGMDDEPPQLPEEPQAQMVEMPKPKKRKDPLAELMEEKPKKKKQKDDLSEYFEDDEEEEAS